MRAATLFPVLPPNWKLGVGNSCRNSNPVRQHGENVQVRKCALCKIAAHQHGCQESFLVDYGLCTKCIKEVQQQNCESTAIHPPSVLLLGPTKDKLSVWKMSSQATLAPCRFSRATARNRVTASGSLLKVWPHCCLQLNNQPGNCCDWVAFSLTVIQTKKNVCKSDRQLRTPKESAYFSI